MKQAHELCNKVVHAELLKVHRRNFSLCLRSCATQCLLPTFAKVTPVGVRRRLEAVPVSLEALGQRLHSTVERGVVAQGAQVISICFMLRETQDFAVAEFA